MGTFIDQQTIRAAHPLVRDDDYSASGAPGDDLRDSSIEQLVEAARHYLGCQIAILDIEGGSHVVATFRDDAARSSAGLDLRKLSDPLAASRMGMRFFAGFPLRGSGEHRLGMLALMDSQTRSLNAQNLTTMKLFVALAVDLVTRRGASH